GLHELARHVLVECDGESERVGAGVGDPEHLAEGGNASLARAPDAGPFREVEDEIRRLAEECLDQWLAVPEVTDGMAHLTKDRGDGADRDGGVELFVEVVRCTGRERAVGLEVEGDADVHTVRRLSWFRGGFSWAGRPSTTFASKSRSTLQASRRPQRPDT